MAGFNDKVSFIWSVADLLRGDDKQSEYGRMILPLVTLRRLDAVLAPTKDRVVERYQAHTGGDASLDAVLSNITEHRGVWNHSPFTLRRLLDAPDDLELNLQSYIASFSPTIADTFEQFGFRTQVERLARAGLLYQVLSRFADVDLHPDAVSNEAMGYMYEELIRRFSEQSNETAGEHFTPREVIRLMVDLLLSPDEANLADRGAVVKRLYDPACGTGGMLTVASDWLAEHNDAATLLTDGQELNPETYATCRSDMLIKGEDAGAILLGNSFSHDGFDGERFDYMLAPASTPSSPSANARSTSSTSRGRQRLPRLFAVQRWPGPAIPIRCPGCRTCPRTGVWHRSGRSDRWGRATRRAGRSRSTGSTARSPG